MWTAMRAALAAVLVVFGASAASAVEEAPYSVVRADGDIEIRDYPGLITAYTAQPGARDDVENGMFRRLAKYIFEDDRPEGEIEMTAPVFVGSKDGARTTMEFVMPERFTRSTLPQPADPGVTLVDRPAKRVAAIRFSGWADDDDLAEAESELRAWMSAQGLQPAAPAEWAFYNPPWTLGPWRRNEVLIELTP